MACYRQHVKLLLSNYNSLTVILEKIIVIELSFIIIAGFSMILYLTMALVIVLYSMPLVLCLSLDDK